MSQRISTTLAAGFCALLLFADVGFAQEKNPTVDPYGGVPDKSRKKSWTKKLPLTFSNRANFSYAKFDSEADFSAAKFNDRANYSYAKFDSVAFFREAVFGDWAYFGGTKFDRLASFEMTKFDRLASFYAAEFGDLAFFAGTIFDSVASFQMTKFGSVTSFYAAEFGDLAFFAGITFDGKVDFVQTHFSGTVDFTEADFKQGVDFRRSSFDSVQTIYLENLIFPEGEFRFHWHQFQGKDSLRIKVKWDDVGARGFRYRDPRREESTYARIQIIYHLLRDNFLAQDDKTSADAVMHELGWQRQEILGEFWWTLYGYFFGWGYQPWRFLLFVVLPVMTCFALLWYIKYYDVLQMVIFKSELEGASAFIEQKGRFFQRSWHSILFSSSVLLGIRFRKGWVVERKGFLFMVSLEWALGIGLIVTFALLVKGARFGFIRDLLGF